MYVDQSKIQSLFKPQFINEVFKKATEQSFVLAHGTRLPNMTGKTMDIDILSNLPIAYWVGADTESRKLTTLALENKRLYAQELSVILPISIDSIQDTETDLEGLIKDRLAEAVATTLDKAILTGKGKPRNFREGLIPSCVNASSTVAQTGTLYSAIDTAMSKVEESDYEVNGFAGGLNVKSMFRNMLDSTGQPIEGTEIGAMPKMFVKNGAWDKTVASLLVGDFKQIYYAIRQEAQVDVFTEATIKDPNDPSIEYNLAQQRMVAFMITMRMGWEIPNPVSAETNGKTHFPFAIVTPASATAVNAQTLTLTVTSDGTAAVKNASVFVGGQEFTSNDSGKVVAKVQNETDYHVVVFADGYAKYDEVVSIDKAAVTKTITLTKYAE